MLTHLLFSISALLLLLVFIITYFSYKKSSNSVRSKIYISMIYFALALTLIEIIEGFTYVYNVSIVFSLMWKLHSILMILFIAALFYYLLATIENKIDNIGDLLWDSKNIISIKNLFIVVFVAILIFAIISIKTYPMGLTMFYFYTNQSINFIVILYLVYIFYTFYIVYLKSITNSFEGNDYIIIGGTFILFILSLVIEYSYTEISVYSTLFTLVLILIYYFKENEDLLMIEELEKSQVDINNSNNNILIYLHELISNVKHPLNTFSLINNELKDCSKLSDEELSDSISNLNYVSNNLVDALNIRSMNRITQYRIDELVKSIEGSVKPNIKSKPIDFTYKIDPNIPCLLMGDSIVVHQILSGLLSNSVEHTVVGKIILEITGEKQKDYEILNITVYDSGEGIKKERFANVFNNVGGDLSLIKRYVEALNGKIYFDSYYGSGSTFQVTIPQKIIDATPISQIPITNEKLVVKDCNNKKVLIIDDEDYSIKKMTSILKKYNLESQFTKSGKDAINIIKGGGDYSLIIINDNVKDINFVEIGRLLKNLGAIMKVPQTLAITVINDGNYLNSAFDNYISKPMNLKKLNEIINKTMN